MSIEYFFLGVLYGVAGYGVYITAYEARRVTTHWYDKLIVIHGWPVIMITVGSLSLLGKYNWRKDRL